MKRNRSVRELLASSGPRGAVHLTDGDASATHGMSKKRAAQDVSDIDGEIFDLQTRLYAESKRALLIVLQGMDTSGKDGTVKHVMTGMNPGGVDVHSFKAPTPEEKRHNFLWRFKEVLPPPGTIGIFNRTYYEDVLIARVHQLAAETTIENRYGEINRFEQQLARSGVVVLKFFLYISYEEQRERLLSRLQDPDKHWKFSENDITERSFWDDYTSAYDAALTRCNPVRTPWYIIPANNKWYRDWAVAQILIEAMADRTR